MTASSSPSSGRPLQVASMMADNITTVMQHLVQHLNTAGIAAEWVHAPWQQLEQMLDTGQLDIAPICGLGYIRRIDTGHNLQLLPSPVPAGDRYGNQPVYYSQVLVRTDSPHNTLSELAATRFATNEPGSHSGYTLIRAHLADLGHHHNYFSEEVITGSHARTLTELTQGRVDAGLVDTTVLEHQTTHDPNQFRAAATLGPSAIPPVVAADHIDVAQLQQVADVMRNLHTTAEGRTTLAAGRLRRFADVTPDTYSHIRQVARKAVGVQLAATVTKLTDVPTCPTTDTPAI